MTSTDQFTVQCPFCGELVEVYVEPDVGGTFVQDCEVCCNPWLLRVVDEGDGRALDVRRGDGSE
ncbi:MAG: CPXCG motif-containing cysteine-rich protein [Vicinamibacterales bacterium]